MEFTLNFTDEECIQFLQKEGFTIETFHGKEEEDFFGTKEVINFTIKLAYKERKEFDKIYKYHLNDQFGLQNMFKRKFNNKIKKILLSW